MDNEYMAAEFKGTYRAPHPAGIRDQSVLRPFHVRVKMPQSFLETLGLNGFFITHYFNFLKSQYQDMIKVYRFELVEATELDGTKINNPRALSYEGLFKYINERRMPINASLYSGPELRNEIILYEGDPKGQQYLQKIMEQRKGGAIAIANQLASLDDVLVRLDEPQEDVTLPDQTVTTRYKRGTGLTAAVRS